MAAMSWQPRRVDLATVANLRELGGARAGTRRVRPGVLFRSTQLASVTDEDSEKLQQLGISTVVDLRTSFEVSEAPERRIGDYIWLDVLADSQLASQASMEPLFRDPKAFEGFLADGTALAFMRQAYSEFVDLPSAQAAYSRWLRDVAASEGALLVHCTNGKDRTGWAVALALLSVGVHLDDVFTDYLTTNDQYLSALGEVFDQVAAQGVDPVLLEPVLGVREEYLQIALDRVADLGGLDAYLRLLQIDDQLREALESRLLS
jgi:protein-tyrosine phosphatase